jgi:hypothetical protein
MKPIYFPFVFLLSLVFIVFSSNVVLAHVPVRISLKFILDANGNRPANGSLNTDAEINAQVKYGIDILSGLNSELTFEQIEFVDLTGLSQWYDTAANSGESLDALRQAAIADPATYHWRTDSINIFINNGTAGGISSFPPDNNIILLNQWISPSTMFHEIGHSLELMHTHETCCTNGDECSDTITDDAAWSRDDVAQNNFGCLYADCSASQQASVDMVFNNVMSYHIGEARTRLSPCQMNRISAQADTDRNWLLSRMPVYVDSNRFFMIQTGTFLFPYWTLQDAYNAGGFANKVLVLQQGAYTIPQLAGNGPHEIVTRSGPSSISRPDVPPYMLPVNLGDSKHPQVRSAIRAVQDEDRSARQLFREAEKAEKNAVRAEDKAAIRAEAKVKGKIHHDKAIKGLLHAEQYAEKDEKLAIQMELAERYRDAGECDKAIPFFTKVAEGTDQPNLRQEALLQIDKCRNNGAKKGP